MKFLKKLAWGIGFNMGALFVTVELLPDVSYTGGLSFFILTGILIGLLNSLIKPILKFLSIPMIFMSAGLFMIVINGVIIWLTNESLEILDVTDVDFQIEGIVNYGLAAIVFGLTNWLEHWLFKRVK